MAGCWRWASLLVGVSALFLGFDPMKMSITSRYPDFVANYGRLAPWEPSSAVSSDKLNRLQEARILKTPEFGGPESLAFDGQGKGPYTGVADGRIMLWNGPDVGWTYFAHTSPNWSEACIPANPTAPNLELEHICGRPLGLRFNKTSGDLYIADAYFGLMVVDAQGGLAHSLTSEAVNQPFTFTNDLDLDADGSVYFTDTSSKYPRKQFVLTAFAWDNTGRLLRYNTLTKETKVLKGGLVAPNGVSLSKDGSFLVVAEGIAARLLRYWLKGPNAGKMEEFALSPGHPDNVRRNEKGEFWVGMHCKRSSFIERTSPHPWLRTMIARLPIPLPYVYSLMLAARPHAMLARFSEAGELLQVLEDSEGKVVKIVSEGEERDGTLWISSAVVPQLALFSLDKA
ncbi:hypothetical protein L7F22_054969 [Adiantum nelumboides]|nr:hypothetical protein [Adiantum nelumboides]